MSTNEKHIPQTETTPTAPKPGRDNEGRFTRGNLGGPGNPYNREVALLRKAIHERMTPEKMGTMVDSLIERGIKGDVAAAKLVLQYGVGKPTEAPNPDNMDMEEIGYFRREVGLMRVAGEIKEAPDPRLLLTLFRIFREAATNRAAKTLKGELLRDDAERKRRQETGEGGQQSKESPESEVRSPVSKANGESEDPGPVSKVRGIELPKLSREEFLALREQVRQKEEARRQQEMAGVHQTPPSPNGKLKPAANK